MRDLNESLNALAEIFPDVQVEVFREMLSSIDDESRLAVVTDLLIREKAKWAHGRYRIPHVDNVLQAEQDTEDTDVGEEGRLVAVEEAFRTPAYINAVKAITYTEFKGLSRSAVNAVLAESNYSYTLARPQLVSLSTKSWRYAITSLFSRKKPLTSLEAEKHPLVIWQSTWVGTLIPTLKGTGCQELDKELFQTLIEPIQRRIAAELEKKDRALAAQLKTEEAEKEENLHECECCFTSTVLEEMTACDAGAHMLCFRCVRHALNEAVFGQGWKSNINIDRGTLRCVAALAQECKECIPSNLVQRAYAKEKRGGDILRKLDERLTQENLLKSKVPLIRCPFCAYAEVDELYLPQNLRTWRLKRINSTSILTILVLIFGTGLIPFVMPFFLLFTTLFLLGSTRQTFPDYLARQFQSSVIRLRRKRIGLRFECRNPTCRRMSCMSCSKGWTDIHICHESSLLALRTQVELAMSQAVKRTCPRCNTSFVKSAGCNKLTCICGYQMCYVCRRDIGNGEGYRHFCEHFRPTGQGTCTECNKCDLYRCESDEVSVRRAKHTAERAWLRKEGGALGSGGAEEVRKVVEGTWKDDGSAGDSSGSWDRIRTCWQGLTWKQALDAIVECVVE